MRNYTDRQEAEEISFTSIYSLHNLLLVTIWFWTVKLEISFKITLAEKKKLHRSN
jgi:hypothetical protein